MKTVLRKILVAILYIIFTKNYGQNNVREYCYNSVDKDGIKTELKIDILADSTYNWKSQILSSPKYGDIKKIDGNESGKIIEKNGKLYLKSESEKNPNSEYEIKLNKNKLIFISYKRQKKILSSNYDYYGKNGLIFRKKYCKKNEN